jgi:hypothetical protein
MATDLAKASWSVFQIAELLDAVRVRVDGAC